MKHKVNRMAADHIDYCPRCPDVTGQEVNKEIISHSTHFKRKSIHTKIQYRCSSIVLALKSA